MSRARLVITAITVQGLTQAEAARTYGISEATVSRYMARWRQEGEEAFEPRSRRPHTSPHAIPEDVVDLIVGLRKELAEAGHDAGPETIAWHLQRHHGHRVSRASISRHLTRAGLITPEPKKKPKSAWIRFQAAMPNETWQSDVTHYRLADGTDAEILTWLDDCTRYALHISAHRRVTTPIVLATFGNTAARHGKPASTLTDNGMVFTVRFSGGKGGRNAFEKQLREWNITQKNSRGNHPQTCGKTERFQQTFKRWLAAQPDQPATIAELQALLDQFRGYYNHHRPHRSLPDRAVPRPSTTPCRGPPRPAHERPRPTTGSASTGSTRPARSPCATAGASTPSASAEPTPEPAS
ncbi:MAG TPA: IS481 family transposase [Marmoricola sp.]|nr:IS481 family transposase [Marmoricola sp.]